MVALRVSFASLLVCVAACAGTSPSASTAPGGNPKLITRAEMQTPAIASMDALAAIRYLRPSFFRTSGPQSFSNTGAGLVQMSHDFGPLRPVSELASLRMDVIYEVRYLDPSEAQLRFGLNANGGPAIVVVSNRQP